MDYKFSFEHQIHEFYAIKPFADFKKINRQVPSTNEMTAYYPDKRPANEKEIIYSIICQLIHLDRRGNEICIYLIDPDKKRPGILLKMIKGGINCVADESKPRIIKAAGSVSFSVAAEILIKNEWSRYLNKLNSRPDKLWRNPSVLKQGRVFGNILKKSGSVLKVAGKILDRVGTVMIYYDILNSESPRLITKDTIQESTINQISRLCQKLPPYAQ